MNAIEVKNLVFAYEQSEQDAINDISFTIPLGSYSVILGHNGSGKSTLAKLLDGLIIKKSGEIKVLSMELNKQNINEIRKKIGIVFQNPDNQFVGSTVEDDIAFGLENRQIEYHKMHELVNEYASKVGMKEYLKKEPATLSGGQKQRVALASVLSLNPDILILDEASAMLDPHGKKEIRELIEKMRLINRNLTIISITHDVEEAYISDYVFILAKGKLVKEGSPKEIFSNEEEIKSLGLEMPLVLQLRKEFLKIGVDLNKACTIEEIKDELCQLK